MNYNSWTSGFMVLGLASICTILFLFAWNFHFSHTSKTKKYLQINTYLKYALIAFILFTLFYFDFLRDYIFKNLQQRMNYFERVYGSNTPQEIVDLTDGNLLKALGNLTMNQAYLYKYIFFGLFTTIYFTLSSLTLNLAYPKLETFKFTSFFYGLGSSIVLIVFSLFFFPWSMEVKNGFYITAMEIGHFFQSSLPTLLLLVSFKIYNVYPSETTR